MKQLVQIWFASLLGSACLTVLAFKFVDIEVARYVGQWSDHFAPLASALGSAVLLSLEVAVLLTSAYFRMSRGHLSRFNSAVALGCLASICAYGINSTVLKFFFGVPTPYDVMNGAQHALHLLHGSTMSSFPSGHMALAGGFAGVFLFLYPRYLWVLAALLGLAAALLVAGDWHFVSDIIAGAFLGVTTGVAAGKLWLAHDERADV